MAVALRRALVWAGTRGTTTQPGPEGSGGWAAEGGIARQGRGNLPTSPSFAAELALPLGLVLHLCALAARAAFLFMVRRILTQVC